MHGCTATIASIHPSYSFAIYFKWYVNLISLRYMNITEISYTIEDTILVKSKKCPLVVNDIRPVYQGGWLNDQVYSCQMYKCTCNFCEQDEILPCAICKIIFLNRWSTMSSSFLQKRPRKWQFVTPWSLHYTVLKSFVFLIQGRQCCSLSAKVYLKLRSNNLSFLQHHIPVCALFDWYTHECKWTHIVPYSGQHF